MSVAELPPRVAPPAALPLPTERPTRFALTYEQLAYLALFVLALITHLWGLGDRALHHDETLHAAYSWRLYTGQGFIHDPLLHGPFLYHIVALMYFLFGDSDFTARLSVALFGSALVVMPYLIRRELGRGAALIAATYLLISPVFLYVGRFIRHDMYAVVFELLTIISMVRYASTRRPRWLYAGAAALGLMATDMETFYLFLAIVGSLALLVFLWRVYRPGMLLAGIAGLLIVAAVFVLPGHANPGGTGAARASGPYVCPTAGSSLPPDNPMIYTPGPVLGLAPLATADNDYALCVRNHYDDNLGIYFVKLGQFFFHPAIFLALAALLGGAGALYLLIWRRRDEAGETVWERACARGDGWVGVFASLAADWRVWIALLVFLTPYTLLFTAFFGHPSGIVTGATGSLLYWLAQHNVKRGDQPSYYYLLQLIVYEPLLLIWGLVGLAMAGALAVRRVLRQRATDAAWRSRGLNWQIAMPLLLTWWLLATVGLYSWAGEKMPWLTVHVALPFVFLGAWAFNRALAWWHQPLAAAELADGYVATNGHTPEPRPRWWEAGLQLYLAIFAAIAGLFFLLITIVSQQAAGQQDAAPFIFPLALLMIALLTVFAGLLRGARWAIGALVVAAALFGSAYTIRNAYQLNYRWGDDARELMVFVQTSPDAARVVRRLEAAATKRSGDLKVWYDNETIWQWYLRNFKDAQQQPPAIPAPGDDVMAVLLLQENIDSNSQNLQNLQGFRIQRYPLRWWNPEQDLYRLPPDWRTAELTPNSPLLMRLLRNPLDGRTSAQVWQYLIYRELPAPLGSTDFVLAVRPALADEIGLGTGTEQK
jgi:predicted membrane-bound mannosyltransferase